MTKEKLKQIAKIVTVGVKQIIPRNLRGFAITGLAISPGIMAACEQPTTIMMTTEAPVIIDEIFSNDATDEPVATETTNVETLEETAVSKTYAEKYIEDYIKKYIESDIENHTVKVKDDNDEWIMFEGVDFVDCKIEDKIYYTDTIQYDLRYSDKELNKITEDDTFYRVEGQKKVYLKETGLWIREVTITFIDPITKEKKVFNNNIPFTLSEYDKYFFDYRNIKFSSIEKAMIMLSYYGDTSFYALNEKDESEMTKEELGAMKVSKYYQLYLDGIDSEYAKDYIEWLLSDEASTVWKKEFSSINTRIDFKKAVINYQGLESDVLPEINLIHLYTSSKLITGPFIGREDGLENIYKILEFESLEEEMILAHQLGDEKKVTELYIKHNELCTDLETPLIVLFLSNKNLDGMESNQDEYNITLSDGTIINTKQYREMVSKDANNFISEHNSGLSLFETVGETSFKFQNINDYAVKSTEENNINISINTENTATNSANLAMHRDDKTYSAFKSAPEEIELSKYDSTYSGHSFETPIAEQAEIKAAIDESMRSTKFRDQTGAKDINEEMGKYNLVEDSETGIIINEDSHKKKAM